MKIILAYFCLVIFSFNQAKGQSAAPLFRHFTTEDGLPSPLIYQVMTDANGYLWLATDRGVVKYNGYEFRTYTTRDGLKESAIFKLYQDKKNKIWLFGSSKDI